MRHPDTVYHGERIEGKRGAIISVRVMVAGAPLALPASMRLDYGFEWGYGGAGANHLALALLVDATEDRDLSVRCMTWFKWAVVANWGATWSITADEIVQWVVRWEHEVTSEIDDDEDADTVIEPTVRKGGAA